MTLAEAIASGDLEPFIAQAEAAGIGAANPAQFDAIVERVVTAPLPSDQTSRSPAGGGLRGK